MGDKSGIEWTDATWNPVVGCSVLSPGCTNCYAMQQARRIERMAPVGEDPAVPQTHYFGTTKTVNLKPVWTGKVALAPERILTQPLRWAKPRAIFVNSMGDLFHEAVPDEWIDRVFAVMALAPQHTFIVLTKRAKRMREYLSQDTAPGRHFGELGEIARLVKIPMPEFSVACDRLGKPLPNVVLGVSAERQQEADERIPDLLATRASRRVVSAEPLLGPIDFRPWLAEGWRGALSSWRDQNGLRRADIDGGLVEGLDGVIVGGESGHGARPMHLSWARSIRDHLASVGVAFHFKQWGLWGPSPAEDAVEIDGMLMKKFRHKETAGRRLDGREHNDLPWKISA